MVLKDIDHHQDRITNMSNLRERGINTEIPTTMLLLCIHIYTCIFMERQREKLKSIKQEYTCNIVGPLIKLCYRASFRNNVVEHYPWSWDLEILFPISVLGTCLSQLFH